MAQGLYGAQRFAKLGFLTVSSRLLGSSQIAQAESAWKFICLLLLLVLHSINEFILRPMRSLFSE